MALVCKFGLHWLASYKPMSILTPHMPLLFLNSTLYNVLYIVLYTVHCTMHPDVKVAVLYALFPEEPPPPLLPLENCTKHYTMYYTEHCIVYCTLHFTVHCTLYTVLYCTIHNYKSDWLSNLIPRGKLTFLPLVPICSTLYYTIYSTP